MNIALVDGERYTPLYEQLDQFPHGSIWIALQAPLAEVLDRLRTAPDDLDLVCGDSRYTASLAPHLLPLDDLIPAADLAQFDPEAVAACRWEGRLVQLPRSIETRLLFYRSDIFDDRREKQWFAEASGGQELRVPRSWEELAAVAQYFTRASRMHGFAFPGRGAGLVATFAEILTTVGGTYFDAEGHPRFLSRAGEWTLSLLRDLYSKWEAVPPETPEMEWDDVSQLFRQGRCALVCDIPNTARLLGDPTFSAVAGWHAMALLPSGPDGRRAAWTGCPTFAIPAGCAQPEAAAALLAALTTPESQLLEAKNGAYPARLDARTQFEESLRAGTTAHLRTTLISQSLRLAPLSAPPLPGYLEFEEAFWPLLHQALIGEREIVEALQVGHRAALAILAEENALRHEPGRAGD